MKIYMIGGSEIYDKYGFNEEQFSLDMISMYKGTKKIGEKWIENDVEVLLEGKRGDLAEFYTFSDGVLVINENVKEKLSDVFSSEDVEFIKIIFENNPLYIVHCFDVQDITVGNKLTFDGDFFEFQLDDIERLHLNEKYYFRTHVKGMYDSPLFFTEKFIDKIKELKLKGVVFKSVWSSEEYDGTNN